MSKTRLEAFSDGVIAILITIMVLEMRTPHLAGFSALTPMIPVFMSYVLSFIYLGIYWNNHHHMLHTVQHVSGGILWANLHLLFWLSLIPFVTRWAGDFPAASAPAAIYGGVLLMAAIAYFILQHTIERAHGGKASLLAQAVGGDAKGKISPLLYASAIALSLLNAHLAQMIYAGVALIWIIPDKRIERVINKSRK